MSALRKTTPPPVRTNDDSVNEARKRTDEARKRAEDRDAINNDRRNKPDDTFEVGGFKVLREGKDLTLVAAGYMVHECLRVADDLAKSGKKAAVIDASL